MTVGASVETERAGGAQFLTTAEGERLSVNFELTLASSQLLVLETLIRKTVREELGSRFAYSGFGGDDRPAQPEQAYATITVAELATNIHQSEGATRKLLSEGLIPGARRKDPSKNNSHWIIPACAPRLYLQRYYGIDRGSS